VNSEQLATEIARYADDRKAQGIVELDMRSVVDYTDFFVICSGGSDRQVKAIHDAIHAGCKDEHALLPARVEGLARAQWVLMDYLDVVVHVFLPEVRDFYALERLWGEVPARALGGAAAAAAAV
jgi:ribosome-associated protein